MYGAAARRLLWLMHEKDNDREGNESGHDGDPEHGGKIIRQSRHKNNRCERTQYGNNRNERLTQAESVAKQLGWSEIRDKGGARRAADALAYPVSETRRCQPCDA